MNVGRTIVSLGFRRWYERQLIESHVCLVTCFLCMVLVAVCLETAMPDGAGAHRSLTSVLVAFAAAAGSIWSWNHYRVVFARAERYGNVAHCEHCGTYARFEVERSSPGTHDDEPELKVRCRQCGHRWTMPDA
jgi:predicted Zn finger-like uncharacterized protein